MTRDCCWYVLQGCKDKAKYEELQEEFLTRAPQCSAQRCRGHLQSSLAVL